MIIKNKKVLEHKHIHICLPVVGSCLFIGSCLFVSGWILLL